MDSVNKVADAAIPSLIGPVSENIAYPFKVSDNVEALGLATDKLAAVQADLKDKIHDAELLDQAGQWSGPVETVKEQADENKNIYNKRSGYLGIESSNCWSNSWISIDAKRKLKDVKEICEEGGKLEEVAAQHPPQVQELPVGSEVVPKEEADLQQILRYIDNDQYDIIGIWGMGGVGKTRLLHLVCNRYKRSSAFDAVIFVTASRECTVEKIQAELCEKYRSFQGKGVGSRAQIISNYLSNRNFLILLDDVWSKLDLQSVGIPFSIGLFNQFKRKVVITTRSESVCGLMGVKKSLNVVGLKTKNAFHLFYENVGVETINSHL